MTLAVDSELTGVDEVVFSDDDDDKLVSDIVSFDLDS